MILTEVFYGGPEAWGLRCALAALRREAITCTVGKYASKAKQMKPASSPFGQFIFIV
jgi:hypothetical protein